MRHLGPNAFVLRLRAILAALASTHFIQHVGGGAAKAVDAVHAGHTGHLLLVGFFALLPPRAAAHALLQRPTHGHTFAIKRRHEDFAFLLGGRWWLLGHKRLHGLGHDLTHVFGRTDADLDSQ